ncbi:MAG: DUF6285 domain-containing protein [Alphaproteobacteria bacterium]
MQDRPTASELLDIARTTLLEELMPVFPDDRRLSVLIIANIMAIAGRELAFGEAPLRHELARLCALYDEKPVPLKRREEVTAAVTRLSRRLAADLRSGAFEEGEPTRLEQAKAHLLETTLQKLRENNPRYLEAEAFQ